MSAVRRGWLGLAAGERRGPLGPGADADQETLVAAYGPVIQHFLTGDL